MAKKKTARKKTSAKKKPAAKAAAKKNSSKKSKAKKAKKAPVKAVAKSPKKTMGPRVSKKKAARKASARDSAHSSKSAPVSTVHEALIYGHPESRSLPTGQAPCYYALAESQTLAGLVLLVQEKLNDGWVPKGGVATTPNGTLGQAIVKF